MRRILAVVGLALLLAPVADAGSFHLFSWRHSTAPGWIAESFTLTEGDIIGVRLGVSSYSELNGQVVALFDGDGRWLAGRSYYSVGGQRVDVTLQAASARATTDGKPGLVTGGLFETQLIFTCPAACNPSREFQLAVATAGPLSSWGYGMFVYNATAGSVTNGTEAETRSSRDFDGTTLHAAALPGLAGVSVTDGTWSFDVQNTLIGSLMKPSARRPERIVIDTPTATRACDCLFEGLPPGTYTMRYKDADPYGIEGFAVVADVRLPG